MSSNVTCPFCGESDFDLIGLKNHLLRGWCEPFDNTESIQEERERQAQEAADAEA